MFIKLGNTILNTDHITAVHIQPETVIAPPHELQGFAEPKTVFAVTLSIGDGQYAGWSPTLFADNARGLLQELKAVNASPDDLPMDAYSYANLLYKDEYAKWEEWRKANPAQAEEMARNAVPF